MALPLRRLIAIAATTAAVGAVGVGIVACGSTQSQNAAAPDGAAGGTASPNGAAQQAPGPGAPSNGSRPQGPPNLTALAEQLGVSTSRLRAAMQAARPAQGSGPPTPEAMASALAQELGLPTAKVQAALEQFMPAPPQGGQGAMPPGQGQDGTQPPQGGQQPESVAPSTSQS